MWKTSIETLKKKKKTDKTPELHILNKTATTSLCSLQSHLNDDDNTYSVSKNDSNVYNYTIISFVWAESTQPLCQPQIPSSSQQLLFSQRNLRTNTSNFTIYSSTSYPSPTTTHLMACICSARVVSDERGICRNSLKCDVEVPVCAAAAVGGSRGSFTILPEKHEQKVRAFSEVSWGAHLLFFSPIHFNIMMRLWKYSCYRQSKRFTLKLNS